jgi:phosphoadenosine phosphosulfate reductase
MIHCARQQGFHFPVFTLDTGLLFPRPRIESPARSLLWHQIESLEPDLTVEEQEDVHGPELWRRTPDLCCTVRKVLPLRDKLAQVDCWITGLRRDQSQTRANVGASGTLHL